MQLPVYEALGRLHLAALALTILLLAGCGLQAAGSRGPVTVTVTEDFGRQQVTTGSVTPPTGSSAYALMRRRFRLVGTPGRVGAIAGVPSGGGRRWFLYLNGVAAGPRAQVYAGERVWWDLHASAAVPQAVVGAFPEPFLHGVGGKRLPTTVECGGEVAGACRRVTAALTRLGVPVAGQALGGGSGQDSLTVEVATWSELRGQLVAMLLARGPASSGVFARFSAGSGRSLEVLDDRGGTASLGPSAGLIAAVGEGGAPPTWLVTGTDAAGVLAAAEALEPARLRDRFALAVAGGRDRALPP